MKNKTLTYTFLSLFFLSFIVSPPQYGIENPSPIGPYLNDILPKKSPSHGNWKAVNAFPNLTFTDPIAMEQIPGEDYYYIAGKQGVIWLVEADENTTEKMVSLDIRDRVITSDDAGLINFILHPEFNIEGTYNQGVIFVNYAFHPSEAEGEIGRMNRLSRFRTFAGSFEIDPDSEEILIQDFDPQGWHMGGGMFFDEDGFLYLTSGDGGGSHDGFNSSQQIDQRLWGGIIRIDIDNNSSRSHPIRKQPIEYPGKPDSLPATFTQGYMIPDDNPWIAADSTVLEEFFGIGLRSPHRASYDPVEQQIWVADVGQGKREEITIMTKGGNAQWPYKQGRVEGPKAKPENVIGEEIIPIYEYERAEGNSVIGGFVYRGDKWFPYLDGAYIFGDHGTQNVWSFNPVAGEVILMTRIPEFGAGSKSGISSFATNEEGDIFVLKLYGKNMDGGVVYRLEIDNDTPAEIPLMLSETGVFQDMENLTPSPGLVPYTVNSPLWSDAALKKRWIALANDGTHDTPEEQINLFRNADWQFPSGTVFIKHFDLLIDVNDPDNTQKVETRFFVIDEDGRGYGLTYKWNAEGTDAILLETDDTRIFEILDEFGVPQQQIWEYPSRTQCLNCHTANANFVLGVKTNQLNGDLLYPSGVRSNQLATWNHLGMFADPVVENEIQDFPKAVNLFSEAGLQQKVSSYLDSNCSHCHRPNGVESAFDARFSTPMAYKNLVNALGKSHNNPPGGMIVSAGEPELSQLWIRDNSIEDDKMPPLAKSMVDKEYIKVLTQWIEGLEYDCNGNFLSDFEWATQPVNGWGPAEKDQSNGDNIRYDGRTMRIAGKEFEKGLGVHAYSVMTYQLERKYTQFSAFIGIDDESCDLGSALFQVYTDGNLRFESPLMRKGDDARYISIDIENVQELKLVVDSPDGVFSCDHANWADARVLRFKDSDGDGICDDYDVCPGADDRKDENGDGVPDDCEQVKEGGIIEMTAMPNPFIEYLDILLKKPDPLIQKASLMVYDLNGRLMYSNFNVAYDFKYRLGYDWHAGIYIVHVRAGAFENRVKVIKHD